MFRDDTSLPPSGMPAPHPLIHGYDEEVLPPPSAPPHSDNNSNNNLDDIWGSGSEPSSPNLPPSNPHSSNPNPNAPLTISATPRIDRGVSDIPRLRSEHSTAGYRDGIAAAKNTTIQEGFDEGFSLGAVIGVRVGRVLGVLEGVSAAVAQSGVVDQEEKEMVRGLVERARRELRTEGVFGVEWWGEDGIWRFEVGKEGAEGDEGGDVTFNDVADAHPLLRKWEEIVEQEAAKWKLDLGVLERQDVQRLGDDE